MRSPATTSLFVLGGGAALLRPASAALRPTYGPDGYSKTYDWLTCDDFLDGAGSIARAVGLPDPRDATPGGRSRLACERIFHVAKLKDVVDGVVNLGEHVRGRSIRDVDLSEEVPDVAEHARLRRSLQASRSLQLSESTCDFEFGFGHPGRLSDATPIGSCADLPSDENASCPHEPCVPDYLQGTLDDPGTYTELKPDYPSGGDYSSGTSLLKLGPANVDTVWNGCPRDRTDANPVAIALGILQGLKFAPILIEAICEAIDDDIEVCAGVGVIGCVCVTCVDLPNPAHVICEVGMGLANGLVMAMEAFYNTVEFQDGLVDGAEIEAAYEHTRNLLAKQCSIYDQVAKRCSETLGIGSGCDGVDNDNDDLVDECDEDVVPPTIRTAAAARCGEIWFANEDEALACVTEAIVIEDDCHEIVGPTFTVTDDCGDSRVDIAVQDGCGNAAAATVGVKISDSEPLVYCDFADENGVTDQHVTWIESGGPGLLKDPSLYYTASDACGEPLRVTVDIYSSEFENRNTHALNADMAKFYQNGDPDGRAGVYLAMAVCDPGSTWICIQDPTAVDARLYTATVTATDTTGFESYAECTLRVLPKGIVDHLQIDTSQSTQRFHVTSYTSTF